MEDKNRELNVDELEQGVGGAKSADDGYSKRVVYLKQMMKRSKGAGFSKEEFFAYTKYGITKEEEEKLSPLWDKY